MKMMTCPLNGKRNINEFVFGGEVKLDHYPHAGSELEWAEHVFYHYNGTDVATEWWLHAPSGYWFIVERNRSSNEIIRSYDAAEKFNERIEYQDKRIGADATEAGSGSDVNSSKEGS